jgi:diguanylate cyclase (GGDEF)-like protein
MDTRTGDAGNDDLYGDQRRAGYAWLRFEPQLEREYRESFVGMNVARIRVAGMVGLAAVFGFVILDELLGKNLESLRADIVLLALCVPAAGLPLLATFHDRLRPHLLGLIQIGTMGVGAGVLAAVVLGRMNQQWFPYESLLLVTAYTYFVSGLMFYQAMFCGMLLWAAFVVSNWTLQSHSLLLYESYYLFVANVIGWLGLYLLDRQARTEFLLRREVQQVAVMDSVTGLLNRRAFNARFETAWLQAQRELKPVGLLLVDLDHFKRINDTCGHQFGDNALAHVGRVLKGSALRPLDAAGRYGGDELIAMWYDVDGQWLGKLAEDLPARLKGLQSGDPKNPTEVTISGGAVLAWPKPGTTMQQAIRIADEMLYERKRNKRGTIGFAVLKGVADLPQQQTAA